MINSITELFNKWERGHCLQVTAPTGSAAVVIKGRTVQSFLGMGRREEDEEVDHFFTVSDEMRITLAVLTLLIIDEVSMIQPSLLSKVSSRLCEIKRNKKPFGGLHVVFAGDFAQLPPVLSHPLYFPVQKYDKPPSDLTISGHALWQKQLNVCVFLTENMRFVKDPKWGETLQAIRNGLWTTEIVDMINTRYLENTNDQAALLKDILAKEGGDIVPIVVSSNLARVKFINHMLAMSRDILPKSNCPIRIAAKVVQSKKARRIGGTFSLGDMKKIYKLRSNRTSNLQMTLDVFVGMPVQITKNICVEKGVANGSIGHVIGYQFKNNECNLGVEFSSSKDGLRIPNENVEVIFVRILGSEQVFHEELSRGVVPLVPYVESVKIQISGRTKTISVEQFPIVPAFSLTVHKVQGLTLKRMILGSWSTKDYYAPSQSYYVMLSSV